MDYPIQFAKIHHKGRWKATIFSTKRPKNCWHCTGKSLDHTWAFGVSLVGVKPRTHPWDEPLYLPTWIQVWLLNPALWLLKPGLFLHEWLIFRRKCRSYTIITWMRHGKVFDVFLFNVIGSCRCIDCTKASSCKQIETNFVRQIEFQQQN